MKMLELRAGPRAFAHIRTHGLRPQDIDIVPGAAGGPKGLGLARLDEWLFADWLPQGFAMRREPINLIGASIGAWRFAAVCRGHAGNGGADHNRAEATRAALAEFAEGYCTQQYPRNANAAFVSRCARELLERLFSGHEAQLLAHPNYQLNVLAVRGKGMLHRETQGWANARTPAGFALAALANAAGRSHLRHFLERTWFTPSQQHQLLAEGEKFDAFTTHHVKLTPQNFAQALVASGSIPLVLEGVTDIPGAHAGTYWDGGLIDYHLHLPYSRAAGLVLYPHFTNKIVPGWLDKALPWRKARGSWLDNVLLIAPSRDYLTRLPFKKLPDRNDFKRFADDYAGRQRYWRSAIGESARLRDELAELVASGNIVDRLAAL